MPRTKGSKNRPKTNTNTTKDYASQITEKQEIIASPCVLRRQCGADGQRIAGDNSG